MFGRASLDSGFFSPTLRLHSMSIFGGAFTLRLFSEAQSLQVFAFPVIGKVIGVEKVIGSFKRKGLRLSAIHNLKVFGIPIGPTRKLILFHTC